MRRAIRVRVVQIDAQQLAIHSAKRCAAPQTNRQRNALRFVFQYVRSSSASRNQQMASHVFAVGPYVPFTPDATTVAPGRLGTSTFRRPILYDIGLLQMARVLYICMTINEINDLRVGIRRALDTLKEIGESAPATASRCTGDGPERPLQRAFFRWKSAFSRAANERFDMPKRYSNARHFCTLPRR